jgi:hypothetical protein
MRKSTELDESAALDEAAARGVRSNVPSVISRRGPAGNDANFEASVPFVEQIEVWAQRALATHGIGDVATSDMASVRRLTSYQLHRAARAHRSLVVGGIIVAAIRALGAIARGTNVRLGERE